VTSEPRCDSTVIVKQRTAKQHRRSAGQFLSAPGELGLHLADQQRADVGGFEDPSQVFWLGPALVFWMTMVLEAELHPRLAERPAEDVLIGLAGSLMVVEPATERCY